MTEPHEVGCFWYTQGRCMLGEMEDEMVLSMLSRIPKAREGIATCGYLCPNMDAKYLKFVSKAGTVVRDDYEINEEFASNVNTYTDHHRLAVANPTLPKTEEDE